jgi:heme-degrading monooxygenase HmoA
MDLTVAPNNAGYVAINYIECAPEYVDRFEDLFRTRAHAIDQMTGFLGMAVLSPQTESKPYLVVSYWTNEQSFQAWTGSEAFVEGHLRAFEDIRLAKERGEAPPMKSEFVTYQVLAR